MALNCSSKTLKTATLVGAVCLLICSAAGGAVAPRPVQSPEDSLLVLKSIPISDWLNVGERAEIPWDLRVSDPYLRIDQRLEIAYMVRISARHLNRAGKTHELFFVTRISSPDGEWLEQPNIARQQLEQELPKGAQADFIMRVSVQPGDYLLWLVLYDRQTGKHNVAKRRLRVPELRGDPLPDLYRRLPLVEFPEIDDSDQKAPGFLRGRLYLPVHNKHPLQVDLVSTLNPPEQWTGRTRVLRAQNDLTVGALAALSQMDVADGMVSITGLDLVRREVLFEQPDVHGVDWPLLTEALKKAQSPELSAKALQGSKNNGAFFREFLSHRIKGEDSIESPVRIIIVVTSSQLFERGSDLTPLQIEGDCHCRVYHLRFRLNMNDVFDEIEKIIKPLHPRTFNLFTARDLRKAIAEIVNDLGKL
jgi:hypothetical protein